jgi:cytochrome c peroxidase
VYADSGRARITGNAEDNGKFKVPSLRNVSLTAPYMHDGSLKTLDEVVRLYERGGGALHPNKDKLIQPFRLNEQERKDLVNFMESLTDTAFVNHHVRRHLK